MESKEKVKDRPVLQSMPTIQVTSPLSEYDCEPDLWDVDSDSEKEVCQDLSNISNDEYSKKKTNFSGYHAPVERTISQQGEIFSEMGTAKKSRSWHGNLKDTDPEGENENASAPISDTISDSNCTSRKHSVVISESATPLSGADDEMSDEESVKAQNRRKSSVLLVPEKKSRHSRRHEGGNCSNSFLFFKHEKPDTEALDAAAKFVAEVLYLAQMEAVQRQSQSVKENLPKINLSEEQSKTKKIQRRVVKLFRRFLRVCGCYHVIPSP